MNIKALKTLRESAGLPQIAVARQAGVTAATYSNIEAGHRVPRGYNAHKIAAALAELTSTDVATIKAQLIKN